MKGQQYITAEYLLEMLEVNDDDKKIYNINWYKNILQRIKKQLKSNNKMDKLISDFENYDSKNQGLLDVANYKTVLLKQHLDITVDEINRMVR